MKRILAAALVLLTTVVSALAESGTWKAYMAYHDVTQIERDGNTLYVLASNDLYSYNRTDHSITTYDKISGLSSTNISLIGWNKTAQRLVIAYSNSNIDLLSRNGEIVNVPDFYNKTMTADKKILSVNMNGRMAYLCTGFGIVCLNVANGEISNTYNLGFRVDYCYTDANYIYAESSTNGLYRASLTTNLIDPNNWKRVGEYTAKYNTIDADLLSEVSTLSPGGPLNNHFGIMKFRYGKLYTATGTTGEVEPPGRLQVWDGSKWSFGDAPEDINAKTGYRFSSLYDFDIDPTDTSHISVGCQSGVYEFRNLHFLKVWNNDNSPLKTAQTVKDNNHNYVIASGTLYDNSGNLWVLNSVSPSTSILKLSASGDWSSHHKKELMVNNYTRTMDALMHPMWDSRGLMWFVNNFYTTPALACYDTQTDAIKVYTSFVNEDGTAMEVGGGVASVSEDYDNSIWMGTNVGPALLTASDINSGSDIFTQVKVPRNDGTDLADYLLNNVSISCMAVDGGNRKWFGTNGAGVFVIASDNITQVAHFTAANSSLLSDNILSIAINPTTGEVFLGTENGLCSYQSSATVPVDEMNKDVTYAYPNPVKPGYTGMITIVGLSYNADVKIVTTNGTLVAEGRSTGGSFQWDGNDLKGRRVASGIYMVETATQTGESGTVCKIAIVN